MDRIGNVTDLEKVTAERDFLLMRASKAGSAGFGKDRWTGMSSNALVTVAFGGVDNCLPSDGGDLSACFLTIKRLPPHLVSSKVLDQLDAGIASISARYPLDCDWAKENAGWSDELAAEFRAKAVQS